MTAALSHAAIAHALRLAERGRAVAERRPYLLYQPNDRGQLQFHCSRHRFRCLFPGTGFGKSYAACAEINAWCRHTNRWRPTPPRPVRVVMFPQSEDQWYKIWPDMHRKLWGPEVRVFDNGKLFEWPDGSTLEIILAALSSTAWTKFQGIEADLFILDEHKPLMVWREAKARRRGLRDSEYIVTATQTLGITWMKSELFDPWMKFHKELGMTQEEAMLAQKHPDLWVWTKGGIDDNPAATEDQRRQAHGNSWANEKEKRVRLYGGFESWVGDPVFNDEALQAMLASLTEWEQAQASRGTMLPASGSLAPCTDPNADVLAELFPKAATATKEKSTTTALVVPPEPRKIVMPRAPWER